MGDCNTDDWLTLASLIISVISLLVAIASLLIAWHAIGRSNQNSSAASLIALNEAFRQGWERFLSVNDEAAKNHQFAELANVLEIACALCVKDVFVGVSKELLTEYLTSIMRILEESDDAKARLERHIQSETTFKYVRLYLEGLQRTAAAA